MTAMQWLILIVAVVILAPLVPWALRKLDFAKKYFLFFLFRFHSSDMF